MRLERARVADAAEIAALRVAANQRLTARHGPGHWSGNVTARWVLFRMRNETVWVARRRGRIVATLTLARKKPWSIDRSLLSPARKPMYLTEMAVLPEAQRRGLGRRCLAAAVALCAAAGADALFLDAFEAKAGAAPFYRKCGFRVAGRGAYRGVPLIYLERLLR